MKATSLLIALSLAANACLLGYIFSRPASTTKDGLPASPKSNYAAKATAGAPAGGATSTGAEPPLPASTVPPAADAPPPETWSRLQSSDIATFTANLRAAGLPDRQVRMLVNAEINDRFRAREEALRPDRPERKYWEQANNYYNDPTTLEQRLAQLDLRREKNALRRELLGDTPPRPGDDNPVPAEKRDLLRQINEDYDTMISQIQRESRGIALPSDEEKLRYLREEKATEMKALLSPEELREHELRSSTTANNLRWNLSAFAPNEQEYRTLFSLQKQFDDHYANTPADAGADYWKQRGEAQKALDAEVARQLGEERYRDYVRGKDQDYRNLSMLTDRLGLPKTTATQVYDLRYSVPTEALKVVGNENLTPDAKRESLKAIAQKTKDQLATQLGAEAAEAYVKRHAQWIKSLENGQVIEYKPNGGQQTHQISP